MCLYTKQKCGAGFHFHIDLKMPSIDQPIKSADCFEMMLDITSIDIFIAHRPPGTQFTLSYSLDELLLIVTYPGLHLSIDLQYPPNPLDTHTQENYGDTSHLYLQIYLHFNFYILIYKLSH